MQHARGPSAYLSHTYYIRAPRGRGRPCGYPYILRLTNWTSCSMLGTIDRPSQGRRRRHEPSRGQAFTR